MSDTPTDLEDPPRSPDDPPESILDTDRYGHLNLEDGAVVIYDREEPDTWLQSDVAVELGV